jgi:hypothetical protein
LGNTSNRPTGFFEGMTERKLSDSDSAAIYADAFVICSYPKGFKEDGLRVGCGIISERYEQTSLVTTASNDDMSIEAKTWQQACAVGSRYPYA